jgi:uncharacterized SAM-binding protein YcdF (DUF218 family)
VFMIKKIVAPLFMPLSLCLELLLVGLFLLWFTRKQKLGKIIVSLGIILLMFFSYGAVSNILLKSLECKYPALNDINKYFDIKWVVVLGGGHIFEQKLPANDQLSSSSLARIVEGIRIHKKLKNSKLILSGGRVFNSVPEAYTMAKAAVSLGVDSSDLIQESMSKDTKDQAMHIKKIVEGERFILVTSASHIPRSIALFEKLGIHPIPAPTDYRVKERQGISPGILFPSTSGLHKAEIAFHEYLGLAWAKIRGKV